MTHVIASLSAAVSSRRSAWQTLALGVVGIPVLVYLLLIGQVRVALALTIGGGIVAVASVRIQAAILVTITYLVFMGDLRRLLIPWVGWSGTDPLLLVGPVVVILLFGYAVASRSICLDTPMAKWMAALMVIMVLQVFNPRQGGLMVGVAGLLFNFVPLLWYWIGRTYTTPAFMKTLLYRVVVPLAVVAALMGYYQTFYGYLPYQQQWYDVAGYVALGPEGRRSALSFFASNSEYTVFMSIAMATLWALVLKRGQYAALGLIAFFFVAVFLTGVRGPIAKFLVAAAGMWAVLGRSSKTWVVRGAFALLIGIVGLTWTLSNVDVSGANTRVQHRVNRQVEGLLAAGEENSSATGHLGMLVYGYQEGLRNPLGRGLGSTTKAAGKFGGGGASMEVDSSDVFMSTGLLGGTVYLIISFLIIRGAVQYWTRTRSLLALALAGVLAITFFGWLKGGQYAASPLVWLCVGALDAATRSSQSD